MRRSRQFIIHACNYYLRKGGKILLFFEFIKFTQESSERFFIIFF